MITLAHAMLIKPGIVNDLLSAFLIFLLFSSVTLLINHLDQNDISQYFLPQLIKN